MNDSAKPEVADLEAGGYSEVPEGWVAATLEECSTFITKGTTPTSLGFEYKDSGIPFIRAENLSNGVIDKQSVNKFIDAKTDAALARSRLQQDDLLFSIAGTIGRTALVSAEDVPANTNQALALIRGTSKILLPRCLMFSLRSYPSQVQAETEARGGSMNNISLEDVRSIKLSIPPLAEQERITAKITEVTAEVNRASRRLQKSVILLKQFRLAVLNAAYLGQLTQDWRTEHTHVENAAQIFEKIKAQLNSIGSTIPRDLEEIPKSWKWVRFGDLIGELRNGISTKPEIDPPGKPILRISAVRAGKVTLGDYRYLRAPQSCDSQYLLKNGDLLFTRYNGTLELLGVCGMVRELHKDLLYPDKLMRVRFGHPWVLPSYTEIFFCSPMARDRLTEKAKSSAGQQGVSGANVKAQPFALPPLEEQQEIVRRVEALFKLADTIEKRVAAASLRADRLTQAVLAKAFRGELVPTEAELARREGRTYEPASALLERIKSERARLSENGDKRRTGRK
jgi:type I restriction enzyme S subunit